jgi:hypothetical protein
LTDTRLRRWAVRPSRRTRGGSAHGWEDSMTASLAQQPP